MKSESEIQAAIQIEGPLHDCILMRNNSGALKDVSGRMVRFGLGNISKAHNEVIKSLDLIGITTVVVTPDMVGKKIGIFTAVEVKDESWKPSASDNREKAQRNFIKFVKLKGGIAMMVNSVSDFVQQLKK